MTVHTLSNTDWFLFPAPLDPYKQGNKGASSRRPWATKGARLLTLHIPLFQKPTIYYRLQYIHEKQEFIKSRVAPALVNRTE